VAGQRWRAAFRQDAIRQDARRRRRTAVFSVLAAGVPVSLLGVRSFLAAREKKAVAASAGKLAVDAAKELHEKAWALAGGDQLVTGLHHDLDTAYAEVSALVLDLGDSGRVPYEGPPFEDRLRLAVGETGAALNRFEDFTAADPERAMVELTSTRDFLEAVIRPRVTDAGLPWMSAELEAQWRHLNWEPYRYVTPGGGAAGFAADVERYLDAGGTDEELLASLKRVRGEIEDRRDCTYVIGLLIDFTYDLAESFGGSPRRRSPRR
jgi:hypothetical protein